VAATPWFFAAPSDWHDTYVVLDAEESHHAAHVLRRQTSSQIFVSDGSGTVAYCSLRESEAGRVVADIIEKRHHDRRRPEIVVYQGASKGGKIDEVVDRLAQLGVAELCVFESIRSVVRWNGKEEKLALRWEALARGAGKQSRNPFVMRTGAPKSWHEVVATVKGEPLALTLWEEAAAPLRQSLPDAPCRLALIVGPEGGFSAEEAASLSDAGAAPVSLGAQIFRTEMAPIVACSAVLWHYGVIG
jgi:16S rRNA (uracil1498-N3)-methyltransferase